LVDIHRFPQGALTELAAGHGDRSVTGRLRAAQHSKHLMLLHAVAKDVADIDARTPALDAFRAGYDVLAKVQDEHPDDVARLVRLPHVGAWAHDCIVRLDQGLTPDYGYLAMLAAVVALRAGTGFELDVPVRDGQVRLPGLGCLTVPRDAVNGTSAEEQDSWVRLSSNGEHLTVGQFVSLRCEALRPASLEEAEDDGTAEWAAWWSGTPLVQVSAAGHPWDVLLEVVASQFGRPSFQPIPAMTAEEAGHWRDRMQAAWQVLARQQRWPLDAFADVVSVIAPLAWDDEADFVSATSPAAFGAIATSLPPDPVVMAETLIHEFQHLKLSALLDLVPLVARGGGQVLAYAPWRPDPRPAAGLLQGLYAHLAIARFWETQRDMEDDPDDLFRAEVLYERWRQTIGPTADTLLGMDCLTPEGVRFVETLRDQGHLTESGPVSPEAREKAEEVALDHWLTWQVSHIGLADAGIAKTAALFVHGESPDHETLPAGRVEPYIRPVGPTVRSQMLALRHCEPKRFRRLHGSGKLLLSRADGLLIDGRAREAVEAYREDILIAADPTPQNWVGLAIAASRVTSPSLRKAFTARLPLMLDVHCHLARHGVKSDPMDLAAWLA
jgi:HEXXH motif-containing protein